MNKFELLQVFENKDEIADLPLCKVLLEDNSLFPWIILIPKKPFIKNMLGLTTEERTVLMKEMEICERVMDNIFNPFQLNIAMIGNKQPQLHIHIVARYENDKYFPETVWGKTILPYKAKEKQEVIFQVRSEIEKLYKTMRKIS